MLRYVGDIEMEGTKISLRNERGALIFFDVAAAFRSRSHEYMKEVLVHIGMPENVMKFSDTLYDKNKCVISCNGEKLAGFGLTAGIRQGCPLSPLLFAVTVDLLLRTLAKKLPDSMTRAFAYDTAMCLPSLFDDAVQVMRIFLAFAKISGLKLNLPKTVVVPLWPGDIPC